MRRINKILIAVILIAVLMLGVGYAAVENITLDIKGTATANPPTLAAVTNENIGDYIDLGNNIVGTEATTDDWRILYVDGGTVYAILADYLPNSTGYAANAGLDTSGTYVVYSETDRDTFLNALTTTSNWSGLANGISGATVTGSPTIELLINSYNTKMEKSLDYTTTNALNFSSSSSEEDYNLYVPHRSEVENCLGYWLSLSEYYDWAVWAVKYNSYVNGYGYYDTTYGVRPVVALPSSTKATKEGDVWTITKAESEEGGSEDESGGETVITGTSAGTYLPTGFTEVAGTSLETGLTIKDELGNQYVWVEVPKDSTVYSAETLALDLDTLSGEELTNAYTAIETDLKEYTKYYRNETTYSDTYSSEAATGLTETEYYELKNKMLKSVFQNGGFYVGKYEVGITSSYRNYGTNYTTEYPITETAVVQANAYPYNWVRCSQAQSLASSMSSGNYTSSLMFGVQWDLVLKHIEVQAVESGIALETIQAALNSDSTDYGNYGDSEYTITNTEAKYSTVDLSICSEYKSVESSYSKALGEATILTTGARDDFSLFGIYDLAGNMIEWTLEYTSNSSIPCIFRGGYYGDQGDGCPACVRGIANATYSYPGIGFRTSIF